jgi:hypothetical protein
VTVLVTAMGVLGDRAPDEEPLRTHQRQSGACSPVLAGFLMPVIAVPRRHTGALPFVEVGVVGRPGSGNPSTSSSASTPKLPTTWKVAVPLVPESPAGWSSIFATPSPPVVPPAAVVSDSPPPGGSPPASPHPT